ncbi:YcgN family cysteine cluster protein [Leucothrix pacifica]|uniref:YcgN family cysteine cluster protein n=1 Tax=Leucothrix pacifica TaxID=1247513 RepID=A0A317CMB4_9GAMM|nr:YcgN family cysteine cluster protein [Leucothrix pacifica]PWQ97450.1 YcgN family cysteine cluster protein [Leucothrix pacifica]
MAEKWWEITPLQAMSDEQWEQICDRCGKCCLIKLQDEEEDGGEIYYTDVACHLFDGDACQCADYKNRLLRVPDCVQLAPQNLDALNWMPPSCSYRRLQQGLGLASWHHLVCRDKNRVHATGNSAIKRVVFERDLEDEDLEDRIVEWPLEVKN